MDRHNHGFSPPTSERKDESPRDYAALAVFVGLVLALLVAGYFAFRNVDADIGFNPVAYVREWAKDMEDKAKGLVGEATKALKIPAGESADAKPYVQRGIRHYRQKNYTEALAELNKAVAIDPQSAEAHYLRGRTLLGLGKVEQGADDFKTAVKLKPDYSEAYDHLGWLAAKQGQVEEGIGYLTKSIELKPDNAWALHNRGRLLFAKGDAAGAMRDAEKACSLGFQEGCSAFETYKNSSREGG